MAGLDDCEPASDGGGGHHTIRGSQPELCASCPPVFKIRIAISCAPFHSCSALARARFASTHQFCNFAVLFNFSSVSQTMHVTAKWV